MLVGISGKIGSGKDTLADIFCELDPNLQKKAFAAKLKNITQILTGRSWADVATQEGKNIYLFHWGMTIGEFLQKLGTEAIRERIHPNAWVLALFADYKQGTSKWVITDVRFKNEAQAIKDKGGILIRLEGDPAKIRENSKRDPTHPSEVDLDDWKDWDFIFHNTSTIDKLKQFAYTVYNEFL